MEPITKHYMGTGEYCGALRCPKCGKFTLFYKTPVKDWTCEVCGYVEDKLTDLLTFMDEMGL